MSGVPYVFGNATTSIPLSQLDVNFSTTATLGNSSVGLGNTTTTVGNLTVSNVTINGLSGGGANGVIYINSSNVATANASVLALDGNGNLGLGGTPSSWGGGFVNKVLQIGTTGAFYGTNLGSTGVVYNAYNNGSNWVYQQNDYSQRFTVAGNNFYWFNAPSGTAGNAITFIQAMTLDASGNLLVGATTTIDQSRLLVQLNSTSTAFSTNGFSGDVTYCPVRIIKYDNNSTTSNAFIRFIINNDGTGSGQINANGSNQAAFGSFSDITLKENIVPLGPQLANINKIEVIEFDYLASEGGGHQIGFSAQNMQGIYPDSVGERLDGKLTLTGWNKTEARLVKAIQELSAQVTALQETVTAQATTISALQAKVGV